MRRWLSATLIFLIGSLAVYAAEDWKGKVINGKGEPVAYASVALLSRSDSTVVCGAVTKEDGTFQLVTKEADGILMVAILGYQTQYLDPADRRRLADKRAWLCAGKRGYGCRRAGQDARSHQGITAAVQKTLLSDGSLILRLEGSDLGGFMKNTVDTDFGNHTIHQSNMMDRQRVELSLRYNFNAAQSKYRGTGAGADTKRRM